MRIVVNLIVAVGLFAAAPVAAAVTSLSTSTTVSGGTSSGASGSDSASVSSSCLIDGQSLAEAYVTLASASAGTISAAGNPFDPGLDQSYSSSASATYSFAVTTVSLFTLTGRETIDQFANIHPPGPIDIPLPSFLTAGTGSILASSLSGFGGSFTLAPGTYQIRLDGSAQGSDVDQGGGFGYLSGFTFARLLDFQISAVPEPATWAMLLLGFGIVGAGLRRRSPMATAAALAREPR